MTQQLDERKITEALSSVASIGDSGNIVTAGAVSGIVVKDGHIGFTIEIDPKDKDKADQLRAAAEKAVLALDGVLSATAMLTAHQSGPSMPTGSGTPPGIAVLASKWMRLVWGGGGGDGGGGSGGARAVSRLDKEGLRQQ